MAVPSGRLAFTVAAIQDSLVERNHPLLLPEFHVPVGKVDEMIPTVIHPAGERDVDERPPLRPFGFLEKLHPGLMRQAIPLACIAGYAGTNDILPCCLPSSIPG